MSRKRAVDVTIKEGLVDMLRDCREGCAPAARIHMYELRGSLRYMMLAGDISEEVFCRVIKLQRMILKKYFLKGECNGNAIRY